MSMSTIAGRGLRKFKKEKIPNRQEYTSNLDIPSDNKVLEEKNIETTVPLSEERWEKIVNGENLSSPVSHETNEKLQILQKEKHDIKVLEKEVLKDSNEVWVPIKSLPSNNKVFKSDNTVFYKKYTFADFEANLPEMTIQQRFKTMLNGLKCTELKSILLLPFYDFTAASFIRKIEAQGADRKYAIPYQCNKCGQIGTFEFTSKNINFETLDLDLPLKVRLHSYPDIIFEFMPHTIGDAIFLMDEDLYYAKNKEKEYLLDITGSPIIDRKSMLAVCCSNFDFNTSYKYFENISFKEDYDILMNVALKLRFGIKNIEFDCTLPKPKENSEEEVQKENAEKLDKIRDWKGELPPILQYMKNRESMCGQHISIDILGGDVLFLPFRESEDPTEFGILPS